MHRKNIAEWTSDVCSSSFLFLGPCDYCLPEVIVCQIYYYPLLYAADPMTLRVARLLLEGFVAQTWDTQAYAKNGAFVHGLAGGVLEWLAAQPGERILDLGCGDGQLTQRLSSTGAHVQGVDASPHMVAAAR